jgi:uncharacterized protein
MSMVSPLYRAILDGDCDRLDVLLAGRDVNMRTEYDQWNLLHKAMVSVGEPPNPEVIRHLIGLGVDVNAKDRRRWTPLHFAARTKSAPVVKLLIEAGAELDAEDDEGITPLRQSILCYPWNLEVIELFLAAGAKTERFRKSIEVDGSTDKDAVLALLAKYQKK